eukprot:GHVN01067966.1.p2 GENE.GHVN01067966.1~~GHVN01067966.1.p2  ORF type:complete len:797 (-),score=87.09 GHVN01067966.1:10000-12390(-)
MRVPERDILGSVYRMALLSVSGGVSAQKEVMQTMDMLQKTGAEEEYLVHALRGVSGETFTHEEKETIRMVCSILLKNSIKAKQMSNEMVDAVFDIARLGSASPNKDLRGASSSLLSFLISLDVQGRFKSLLAGLQAVDEAEAFGSLEAARRLVEDTQLTGDILAQIYVFCLPLLSRSHDMRQAALKTIREILRQGPDSLGVLIERLFSSLDAVLSDGNEEIQAEVAKLFLCLLEEAEAEIEHVFKPILENMLGAYKNGTQTVKLEAGEFWHGLLQKPFAIDAIEPLLPQLVVAAVKNVVYEENDIEVASFSREERGGGRSESADVSNWTVRKCSSLLLDTLSLTFERHAFFPLVLPLFHEMLGGKADWRVREAGFLVLGAVVESFEENGLQYIFSILFEGVVDSSALVRKTAIWALGRSSLWMSLQENQMIVSSKMFAVYMAGMQDLHSQIRRCSILAMGAYCENGGRVEDIDGLVAVLKILLCDEETKEDTLMELGTINCVLDERQKLSFRHGLIGTLLALWNETEDLPLLVDTISLFLGRDTAEHNGFLLEKCGQALHSYLQWNDVLLDEDDAYILAAHINLLGTLIGLGVHREWASEYTPLVERAVEKASHDSSPQARQAGFALLGDMCRYAAGFFGSILAEMVATVEEGLRVSGEAWAHVLNNAAWAYCELYRKGLCQGRDIESIIYLMLGILEMEEEPFVIETVVASIGTLLASFENKRRCDMAAFVSIWSKYISDVQCSEEQEASLVGVCSYFLREEMDRTSVDRLLAVCEALGKATLLKAVHDKYDAYK